MMMEPQKLTAVTLPSSTWDGVRPSAHQRMHVVSVAMSCLNALNYCYSRRSRPETSGPVTLLYLTGAPRPASLSLRGSFHYWDEAVTQRPLSSMRPECSAQSSGAWTLSTSLCRKDDGQDAETSDAEQEKGYKSEVIFHCGQALVTSVAKPVERSLHTARTSALLSVPARGWRALSPGSPFRHYPRVYLQEL